MRSFFLCLAVLFGVFAADQSSVASPTEVAPLDLDKATNDEIKAWLKRDENGNLLRSQIEVLRETSWPKDRLVAIFGRAEEYPKSIVWERGDGRIPVTVVEDRKDPDLNTGEVSQLRADRVDDTYSLMLRPIKRAGSEAAE